VPFADADMLPSDIGEAHIGNFCGELFTGQGQLGGMLAVADRRFDGVCLALDELERRYARRALVVVCGATGLATAVVIER